MGLKKKLERAKKYTGDLIRRSARNVTSLNRKIGVVYPKAGAGATPVKALPSATKAQPVHNALPAHNVVSRLPKATTLAAAPNVAHAAIAAQIDAPKADPSITLSASVPLESTANRLRLFALKAVLTVRNLNPYNEAERIDNEIGKTIDEEAKAAAEEQNFDSLYQKAGNSALQDPIPFATKDQEGNVSFDNNVTSYYNQLRGGSEDFLARRLILANPLFAKNFTSGVTPVVYELRSGDKKSTITINPDIESVPAQNFIFNPLTNSFDYNIHLYDGSVTQQRFNPIKVTGNFDEAIHERLVRVQKMVDDYNAAHPDNPIHFSYGGSTTLVGNGKMPWHNPNDSEFTTTSSDLSKLADLLGLKLGPQSAMAVKGDPTGKVDIGSHADFNVIDVDKNDFVRGDLAHQIYRMMDPKHYLAWRNQDAIKGGKSGYDETVKIVDDNGVTRPVTVDEFFSLLNQPGMQLRVNFRDMFEAINRSAGVKTKHVLRTLQSLMDPRLTKDVTLAIRDLHDEYFADSDYWLPHEYFKNLSFNDVEANKKFLNKHMGIFGNEAIDVIASNPEMMQNAFDLWYAQNFYSKRFVRYVTGDDAVNALFNLVTQHTGGSAMGPGRNAYNVTNNSYANGYDDYNLGGIYQNPITLFPDKIDNFDALDTQILKLLDKVYPNYYSDALPINSAEYNKIIQESTSLDAPLFLNSDYIGGLLPAQVPKSVKTSQRQASAQSGGTGLLKPGRSVHGSGKMMDVGDFGVALNEENRQTIALEIINANPTMFRFNSDREGQLVDTETAIRDIQHKLTEHMPLIIKGVFNDIKIEIGGEKYVIPAEVLKEFFSKGNIEKAINNYEQAMGYKQKTENARKKQIELRARLSKLESDRSRQEEKIRVWNSNLKLAGAITLSILLSGALIKVIDNGLNRKNHTK